MIAHTILALYIGGLFGFAVAAIMMAAGDADREGERQEKETEKPPVTLICEEQKLEPFKAKVIIPREELEHIDETKQREYINYKLMGAIEKQLLDHVIVERDPRYLEYVCTLRLWTEKEIKSNENI